jgi:hypothetical protein
MRAPDPMRSLMLRALRDWDRPALVESLAWTDDDVLYAVDRACDDKHWQAKLWPGRCPAIAVLRELYDGPDEYQWVFERLAMASLRPVLRRLRGQGLVDYASLQQLREEWYRMPYERGDGPWHGLWTVTPFGDERLAWLDGELEYGFEASPVFA